MKENDIRDRVERIRNIADDDEAAHAMEDQLYVDVLTAISHGLCKSPRDCAEMALKARDIKFARWCA